jgi:UDP:flavonoid glycosyltransferase YjiC (YdhE family)
MHYGIFTYGSRGDVQPCMALSLGLIKQGHQVSLYAPENFKDFVESYGINFHPLYGDAYEILCSPEGRKVLKTGSTLSLLKLMQKGAKEIQPHVNRDTLEGCKKVDAIIASVLCQAWVSCIAEKLHKKWGALTFSPPTTPTKEFPFAGMAFFDNPIYNKFSHNLVRLLYWKINKKDINEFRKSLALPILTKNILDIETANNTLNLYAFSPSIIPRPKDWKSNSDITGFLTLPSKKINEQETDGIAEGLSKWLAQGKKPIYIGFGSIPIPDVELFRNVLNEILSVPDMRILFCKGWSEIPNLPQHPDFFTIKYADHEWLLPQCEAAIIHGGAGTIAAVLKAKIPVIIASIFADQPWWGKIVEQKKLGVHITFKKLTAKSLLSAIKKIQTDEYRNNAAEIGEKISHENGVEKALEHINKYFV